MMSSLSYLEERLRFECDFCSLNCKYRKSCNHVYDSKNCKILYNALVKEGFIKVKEKDKMIEIVECKGEVNKKEEFNINNVQRNILAGLMNARLECMEENVLTARGFEVIIDALFYLVKELPYCTVKHFIDGEFPEVGYENKKNK